MTAFVLVLQTVLQELRNLNLSVFKRMCSLITDEKKMYVFYPNELSAECVVVTRQCHNLTRNCNPKKKCFKP